MNATVSLNRKSLSEYLRLSVDYTIRDGEVEIDTAFSVEDVPEYDANDVPTGKNLFNAGDAVELTDEEQDSLADELVTLARSNYDADRADYLNDQRRDEGL